MKLTDEIKSELEAIRLRSEDGLLKPEDVLARAEDPSSPLHAEFNWDDTEAAREWRLFQARQLIVRIKVTMEVSPEVHTTVRAYVSLASDRLSGAGYRPINAVFSDDDMRAELLKTAMAELMAFQRRYARLEQLAPVFAAMQLVLAETGEPEVKRTPVRKRMRREPALAGATA